MEKDKKIKLILNIVKGKSGEEDQKYIIIYEIIDNQRVFVEKIKMDDSNNDNIKFNDFEIEIHTTDVPLASSEDEIVD